MTFDEFCNEKGITGGIKENFLEYCAEDLELDEDEEEIPDQSKEWFESILEDFRDVEALNDDEKEDEF